MVKSLEQTELLARLADEKLRADALAAELEAMRRLPSWQAIEFFRLRGHKAQKLARAFRRIAIFILRLVPSYSLRKQFDDVQLAVLKKQIIESKLFDPNWYAENYAGVGDDPAAHFLHIGAGVGHDPGPLFESKWYQKTNPGIGGRNPLLHYLDEGAKQGRLGWSMQRAIRMQRPYFKDTKRALLVLKEANQHRPFPVLRTGQSVCVYASSEGNSFFKHLQGMVCSGLQQAGVDAKTADETSGAANCSATPIILAPHEFFTLGAGVKLQKSPAFSSAVCINTEQIQTPWFSRAFPYLARAAGVLDFNVQGAAVLADLGIPAKFLTPGYLGGDPVLDLQESLPKEGSTQSFGPAVFAPPPARHASLAERPIDILFVGANTARREQFFAAAAPVLADKVCVLHLTDMSRPVPEGGGQGMSALAYAGLSQRSKIQLNIHQGVLPYFEWHRMVLHGFWHQTAVVSETGFHTPGYEPGIHYFEDELAKLPAMLDWLLRSEDGQMELEKVSMAAFDALRSAAGMQQVLCDVFQIGGASDAQ